MQYSLDMLVHGEADIVRYYRTAAERWREIWSRPESQELYGLADILRAEEKWFEQNCGGPWIGQEVMVVSGLGGLYTRTGGFADNLGRARLLYDAFRSSFCSVAVLSFAEKVARSYHLLAPVAV